MTDLPDSLSLRWCFSTLGCPELSLPEACALAQEFHLTGLELRALNGTVDLPQLFERSKWDRATMDTIRQGGILPAVAGSSFKLTSNSEQEQNTFLSYCAWAESLRIPFVRVFGGGTWGTALSSADYQQAIRNLEWWRVQRRGREWSLEMLIETHDAFSASGPCLELQRLYGLPLTWIWDSHHTWRLGGELPVDTWAALGPWIRHVHVKDSLDKPSARHPYTYVLPGEGQMPLGEVIALLRAERFAGFVSLEWERLWHPYLPPLRNALSAMQTLPWFSGSPEPLHLSRGAAPPTGVSA
jgi:sugar phosphate isomerase/epimerase